MSVSLNAQISPSALQLATAIPASGGQQAAPADFPHVSLQRLVSRVQAPDVHICFRAVHSPFAQ
jgi:hypothetical protein